jgi:hypothetical protein
MKISFFPTLWLSMTVLYKEVKTHALWITPLGFYSSPNSAHFPLLFTSSDSSFLYFSMKIIVISRSLFYLGV